MPRQSLKDVMARKAGANPIIEEEANAAAEEPTIRFNMNMRRSLHRRLKREAFERECDMKDIVEEALTAHLSK